MAVEAIARRNVEIPRVSWDDFLSRFQWRQGDHVTLLGPTGQGKTTLALRLLPLRQYVVVFGTKPRDDSMDYLLSQGYRRISKWDEVGPVNRQTGTKVLLWPDSRKATSATKQRDVFMEALRDIYEQGSWACYFDEVLEFTTDLKMPNMLNLYWRQGRSIGISVIGGSQRPAYVPLYAYSQAQHLFLWRTADRRDTKRLGEISGNVDRRIIESALASLDYHEPLYVNTRTGEMLVTQVQL